MIVGMDGKGSAYYACIQCIMTSAVIRQEQDCSLAQVESEKERGDTQNEIQSVPGTSGLIFSFPKPA